MNVTMTVPTQTRRRKSEKRLGPLHEPAAFVDGPNQYQYVGGDPVGAVDPEGMDVHVVEIVDDKVCNDPRVNSKAYTKVLEGRIYVQWASCGAAGTRPSSGPSTRPTTGDSGLYRVVAVYDHLDVLTGYASIELLRHRAGDFAPGLPDPRRQIAAKAAQAEALQYERDKWQAGIRDAWESGVALASKTLRAGEPQTLDELRKRIASVQRLLEQRTVNEWGALGVKDAEQIVADRGPVPVSTRQGELAWKKVKLEWGPDVPSWAVPTTQPAK